MTKENNISVETKEKIRQILEYVNLHSLYYNKLFKKNNIDFNDDILNIMKKIPITDKETFRLNYASILTDSTEKYIEEFTSGSTGIPLMCLKTIEERISASLAIWNNRKRWDKDISCYNYLSVWDDLEIRKRLIDVNSDNLIQTLKYIMQKSPRWFQGPITIVEKYANLIESGKIKYNGCIKFIELLGEYVTPYQRSYIEYVFKCKTIVMYGTREAWCIAYECKCNELHILENNVYLETIYNNNGYNEVVLTSLYNKKMPLIRYNTYDLGIIKDSDCNCGNNNRILSLSGGRVMDVIKGKNILGNVFFGRIFGSIIKKTTNCVAAFKVNQTSLLKFMIYIVKGENYSNDITLEIFNKMKKELGNNIEAEFIFVNNIPISSSGKSKVFESFL